jgi:hypothetical protein
MISTVEKEYNINNELSSYKVTYQDGTVWKVPPHEANKDYQEILEWVAAGNTITDPGA